MARTIDRDGEDGRLLARLGIAIGVELYTVADALQADFAGTLAALAAIGYSEVEIPSFQGHRAEALRKMLDDAGLACPCVHYTIDGLKRADLAAEAAFAHIVGVRHMICIIPTDDALRFGLDDYARAADDLALLGDRLTAEGLQAGFHGNYVEMKPLGATIPFDLMMARMPADLVDIQLDVANVARAGHDPAAYLRRYAGRISTIHIKDLLLGQRSIRGVAGSIELGRGDLDWPAIFAAMEQAPPKACYFELEPFGDGAGPTHGWSPSRRDRIESARMNHDFLRAL